MKTLNTKLNRISLIALAAIGIVCFCVMSRQAARAEDKVEFLAYGVGGVTMGQTARFHAVSVGVGEIQHVELMFFDRDGNLLAHSMERLLPGRSASLDFTPPPADATLTRVEIYTVMRFVNGAPKRGYVIPSLEVIDNSTGKTILMSTDPTG